MKPSHRRMYIFNWNNFWHGSNKNKSWAKGELGMKQELKSEILTRKCEHRTDKR